MASNPSAEKRHRQNEKRRARNKMARSAVRTEIRKFQEAVKSKDKDLAREYIRSMTKLLDTATRKGIYHKNYAARKKSRLRKQLNSLSA